MRPCVQQKNKQSKMGLNPSYGYFKIDSDGLALFSICTSLMSQHLVARHRTLSTRIENEASIF